MQALLETSFNKEESMTPLLIEAQRLKQFSTINSNVDNKLIEPTIIIVQDIYLQSILGTDLYEEICNQVDAANVSVLNKTLLDQFIENYLLNMVVSQGLVDWNYKFSNKNVAKLTADNTLNADLSELERIGQKYIGQAEFYAKRLSAYLCDNAASYPLYLNGNNESWKIRPIRDVYTSNFYTGNKRVDYRNEYATHIRTRRRR
jgi:hypothetical protein